MPNGLNGLVDIGGGVKMLDPKSIGSESPTSGISDIATLVNLQQNLQNAPLERKKLEIETTLRYNELLNADVSNLLQRANLQKAIGDETRAQVKFMMESYKMLPDLYAIDPNIGNAALQQLNPKAVPTVNDDGTVSVEIPTQEVKTVDGKQQVVSKQDTIHFNIDPNRLDPEKKASLEGQWYERFQRAAKESNYAEISDSYKNLKSVSSLATGQGDIALIYNYMKMVNPGMSLRPGQTSTLENTGSVFGQLGDLYNRALTKDSPIFGKAGSDSRKKFIEAADTLYQNARESMVAIGRDTADFAMRQRLDPKTIISPVGDIPEESFLLTDQELLNRLRGYIGKSKQEKLSNQDRKALQTTVQDLKTRGVLEDNGQ